MKRNTTPTAPRLATSRTRFDYVPEVEVAEDDKSLRIMTPEQLRWMEDEWLTPSPLTSDELQEFFRH